VSLKSTRHRNTGIGPEEVEEEPMATSKVQKQQFFYKGTYQTNRSKKTVELKLSHRAEPTEKSRAEPDNWLKSRSSRPPNQSKSENSVQRRKSDVGGHQKLDPMKRTGSGGKQRLDPWRSVVPAEQNSANSVTLSGAEPGGCRT
jgi:hypothetical protein